MSCCSADALCGLQHRWLIMSHMLCGHMLSCVTLWWQAGGAVPHLTGWQRASTCAGQAAHRRWCPR